MKLISNLIEIKLDQEYTLLINSLNGYIDLINEYGMKIIEEWKLQDEVIPTTETEELYQLLKQRGYLRSPTDEAQVREELITKFRQSLAQTQERLDPTLIITYDCNLRCKYCYEKNVQEKGVEWLKPTLTRDQVAHIFQYLDQSGKIVEEMTLYGGEPLLRQNEELIRYILDQGQKRGIRFFIITNGVTLDYYAPILKDYQIRGIQVTLDGPSKVHDQLRVTTNGKGSFEQIIHGLESAVDYGLPIFLRSNVNLDTIQYFDQLLQELKARGLTREKKIFVYLAPIEGEAGETACHTQIFQEICNKYAELNLPPEVTRSLLSKFHEIVQVFQTGKSWPPKFVYCNASSSKLYFDPHGDLYTCGVVVGEKKYAVGRYQPEVLFNTQYEQWRARTIENIEKCSQCKDAFLCGGGCPAIPLKEQGDILLPNCNHIEVVKEVFVPFFFNLLVKPNLE